MFKRSSCHLRTVTAMTETTELPLFPTTAPAVFCDADATRELYADVLKALAGVIDVNDAQLQLPTPCAQYNVGELRQHVLGWLDFFATALSDPAAASARPDPEAFALGAEDQPSDVVRRSSARIQQAIADDAALQTVTMTGSRMAGDGVLGMALGEYMVHAWDLATSTGQSYEPPAAAVGPAHEFLQGMVAPEYRGPDSGFFDHEVEVPDGAPAFDQLLGFAGRNPNWAR